MVYKPDAATSTVFATLSFASVAGVTLLIIFELLRRYTDIYTPRFRFKDRPVLPAPPKTPLMWIPHVLSFSDEEILESIGLDGLVFLRFLRLCIKMTGIAALCGIVFLIPVYSTGPGVEGVVGINLYTMGNIQQKGRRLWVPVFFTYVFSLTLLYLLHKEYALFARMRQKFLMHGDIGVPPQRNYSVVVENVPMEYRSSEKLMEMFESLFPGEVASASMTVQMKALTGCIDKRKAALGSAEKIVAQYMCGDSKEPPTVVLLNGRPLHGFHLPYAEGKLKTKNALEFYKKRIMDYNARIARYQGEVRTADSAVPMQRSVVDDDDDADELADRDEYQDDEAFRGAEEDPPEDILSDMDILSERAMSSSENRLPVITKKHVSGTGFVTFKTRRAQATATQVTRLSQKYSRMKAFPAPEPNDIVWSNITVPLRYIEESMNVTHAMYLAGILFWAVVLAFIAALSNLENLDNYLPFIKDMDPVLYAIVAGLLPVLVLVIFMQLLPVIMTVISELIERQKTYSAIHSEVLRWYFFYQLANVYVLLIAGSVLNSVADIIDDPGSILALLGSALPSVSIFFTNYVLNAIFLGTPVFLLRWKSLLMFLFYRHFVVKRKLTRREVVEGPLAPEYADYGDYTPSVLYAMAIFLIYWTIAPILTCLIAILFAVQYVSWLYNFLYIYVPKYEAGGFFWYAMYRYTMFGLVGSTLTIIGYTIIKEGNAESIILLPLLYIIHRAWNYTTGKFELASKNLAFSNAVEVDLNSETDRESTTFLQKDFRTDLYVQPAMSASPIVRLHPYRIDDIPLFNGRGDLDQVYYVEQPLDKEVEGTNPLEIVSADTLHIKGSTDNVKGGYVPPPIVATPFYRESTDCMVLGSGALVDNSINDSKLVKP